MKYRPKEEAERAKLRDPITLYQARLMEKGLLSEPQIAQLDEETTSIIDAVLQLANEDPYPALEDRFEDILAEKYPYQPA